MVLLRAVWRPTARTTKLVPHLESQALLRATPIAGDRELGVAFAELIDRLRWPPGGLTEAQVTEIKRVKARVEAERLPRGADPRTAHQAGTGRPCRCRVDGAAAPDAARLDSSQSADDVNARCIGRCGQRKRDRASGCRNTGRGVAARHRYPRRHHGGKGTTVGQSFPATAQSSDWLGVLGYGPGSRRLVEDYRRVSRRARAVVEEVFYG